MFKTHNPPDVLPPVGPLSWGLVVGTPQRLLVISGQVGADTDGRIGADFIEQAVLTWRNVGHVLAAAGMGPGNLIRTGIFLTRHVELTDELVRQFNAVRVGFLGEHRPASTMIVVHALMHPQWLIEIDGLAAQ
jgi:enamine deaminase RidA (YjgF/YER057c/UK114 family)